MNAGGTGPGLAALIAAAAAWIEADPDPDTRAALAAAVERADPGELTGLVGGRVSFGTAGLRAAEGPGPNRINRLVARQTAAGLAEVLRDPAGAGAAGDSEPGGGPARRLVVVGRDGRHGSAALLAEIVDVLTAAGIDVMHFEGTTPTPVVAWALRQFNADAALVVTASHNPPSDNGIKVYWGDGAQIVPPIDRRIAEAIDRIAPHGNPDPAAQRPPGVPAGASRPVGPEVLDRYVEQACRLVGPPASPIRIATTALHGVGHVLLHRVLTAAGYTDLHTVAAQRDPDPEFPTVAFPNPEEPGATGLLLDLASRIGATVAIANDPDADRVAVALPDADGVWRQLTGDEVGAVLAHHRLRLPSTDPRPPLVTTTVVSSQLTARIAEAAGALFTETLTGFKWLCRPAMAHPHHRQVLAYEEALGYAVGAATLDKDGITAALAVADLVAHQHAAGRTLWDVLDDLHRAHGVHLTRQLSVRIGGNDGPARIARAVAELGAAPPERIGDLLVTHVTRPAPDVLRLHLDGGSRVVIRPSGTEPRIKAYLEVVRPPMEDLPRSRAAAHATLDAMSAAVGRLLPS